jgi:hypothetical protein
MIILRQKYYSDNKERNNDEESTGKKIAKGAAQVAGGTTLAGLVAAEGYQYGKGLQRDLLRARRVGYRKESKEAFDKFLENPGDVDALNKYKKIEDKISKSLDKENKESKLEKFGHKVEDKVEDNKAAKWLRGETEKDSDRISKRMSKNILNKTVDGKDVNMYKEYKRAKNINRLGKAAMIATPIAVASGTALAIKKKKEKKDSE